MEKVISQLFTGWWLWVFFTIPLCVYLNNRWLTLFNFFCLLVIIQVHNQAVINLREIAKYQREIIKIDEELLKRNKVRR